MNKKTGLSTPFESNYEWYESFNSSNKNDTQNSGLFFFFFFFCCKESQLQFLNGIIS